MTYIDADGRVANLSDYINTTSKSLAEAVSITERIGQTDLFGDVITEESAKETVKLRLSRIADSLHKVAAAIQ